MAESTLSLMASDIALSVTGLAGPSGDGSAAPVGTVWIAGACRDLPAIAFMRRFTGRRNSIRKKASEAVIEFGLELVNNHE
jgi:nicotinamide mononucleotide (NMN) deamidase PncC